VLTVRAGILAPIGNDNDSGFIASSAGAFQRPTDAAASFPSSLALRTGASLTRARSHLVLQGDGGVDWLLGGEARPVDALLRANAGVGVGMRAAVLSLELSNTVRVSDPSRRIHALGIGGTFWLAGVWLTTCVSRTFAGQNAVTASVGYEL